MTQTFETTATQSEPEIKLKDICNLEPIIVFQKNYTRKIQYEYLCDSIYNFNSYSGSKQIRFSVNILPNGDFLIVKYSAELQASANSYCDITTNLLEIIDNNYSSYDNNQCYVIETPELQNAVIKKTYNYFALKIINEISCNGNVGLIKKEISVSEDDLKRTTELYLEITKEPIFECNI